MSEPVVQLKNVSKRIGRRTIVERLNLDIYPGEVFGFLGPNGAGKTTTIRMMVGLISMSQGDIFYKGASIKTAYRQAIRHVGAIVENPEMYKYLSGYANLQQYARMIGGIGAERIAEIVRLVGLEDRIHDKVKTYSLGMRQRLGLAQALLHEPSVLILDEPTNGLDPAGIREIRLYIRKLAAEQGLAVLVSSHLLSEMEMMCDRFAVLQHGRLKGIQAIREDGSGSRKAVVRLKAEPLAQARSCLESIVPRMAVREQDGELLVDAPGGAEAVPELVAALVRQDIRVFQVQSSARSLEDLFMDMTEGD